MHLMVVVTTYLYGSLDFDIYMRILEGYKMPEAYIPRDILNKVEKIFVWIKAIRPQVVQMLKQVSNKGRIHK